MAHAMRYLPFELLLCELLNLETMSALMFLARSEGSASLDDDFFFEQQPSSDMKSKLRPFNEHH